MKTTRRAVLATMGLAGAAVATTSPMTTRPGFNVKDYGAVGDGVTDDTEAINAAAAAAKAAGATLHIPAGTYRIDGTVNFDCSVDGSDATLRYFGTGIAVNCGAISTGQASHRRNWNLPSVRYGLRPGGAWDGSSVGIRLCNSYGALVHIPYVDNFETGVLLWGDGAGCTFNTVHMGTLFQNRRQLVLTGDGGAGYANQNTFIGGRLHQSFSGGAADEDTGAYQIKLGSTVAETGGEPDGANNNTFVGMSLEGDNPAYYRVWCNGRFNAWYNCRWEAYNQDQSRVYWGPNSYSNTIHHGYEAWKLTEHWANGGPAPWSNEIVHSMGVYIDAPGRTANQDIPSGDTYTTITGMASGPTRIPYNPATGIWMPKPGLWQINATVGFAEDPDGYRGVRLLKGGDETLGSATSSPASGGGTIVNLSTQGRFNGSQALRLQARQTSGGDLAVLSTDGFCVLKASRIGPEGPGA